MNADADQLTGEESIVWLEPPERFPYVRETVVMDAGTRRRPLSWKIMPGRLVGYSVLRRDAKSWMPGYFIRRAFWVKDYDRSEDPTGIYRTGCPAEGVDPLTVAPGIPGAQNARAWECACFDAGAGFPGTCPSCRRERLRVLRGEVDPEQPTPGGAA